MMAGPAVAVGAVAAASSYGNSLAAVVQVVGPLVATILEGLHLAVVGRREAVLESASA